MLDVPRIGFLASVIDATFDGDRNVVPAALCETSVPQHTDAFRRKLPLKKVIGVLVPAPDDHCQLLRIHAGMVRGMGLGPLLRVKPQPIVHIQWLAPALPPSTPIFAPCWSKPESTPGSLRPS